MRMNLEKNSEANRIVLSRVTALRTCMHTYIQNDYCTRYVDILREFVAVHNALEDTANTSWFMQDGARPHRTADVFNFLNEHFDDPVIALGYPTHTGSGVDWPPYSPDMNPCDFFLWGHLKDQVYHHNRETIEQLKQYISSACEAIPPDTFTKVSGNFVHTLRPIIAAHGG